MSLTAKQQKFIDEYLQCFNATEAARQAGYKATNGSLATIGYNNLRNVEILKVIKQHFEASAMSAEEALQRLAAQARGDIGDFTSIENSSDLANHPQSFLVKKYKKRIYRPKNDDPYEEIELEIYDAHAALVDIGRHHSTFTDKIEHSGSVESRLVILPPNE